MSEPIPTSHQFSKHVAQGDGKHAGSGNYGGSKHFSWMISFGTAEEQAKTRCDRGGEGRWR